MFSCKAGEGDGNKNYYTDHFYKQVDKLNRESSICILDAYWIANGNNFSRLELNRMIAIAQDGVAKS